MPPSQVHPHPAPRRPLADAWRRLAAHLLGAASVALARRARDVARPLHARQRRGPRALDVEFHADAGAPEGAWHVDGEFAGLIDVHRP